jgi:formimidoylglutamate deiminase
MVTFHFDKALTPTGWQTNVELIVESGRISALTSNARRRADAEHHAIAIPGMPNLHSHAFQRAMSGLAEMRGPGNDSFWSWREVMYRFALSMSPDDVEAVAAQAYAEMLEGGFTRVGEFHYLHHDKDGSPYADIAEHSSRIAEASTETGIGLTCFLYFTPIQVSAV